MKKAFAFALILVVTIVLCFTGCGEAPDEIGSAAQSESGTNQGQETPASDFEYIENSDKSTDSSEILISEKEAYDTYYDLIERFDPKLMTVPQECDVDIITRDEVTFLTEHFVRNTNVKIQSQVVDGKLQYYLLNQFPEADRMNFYCINDDRFYSIDCRLNEKGKLVEYPYSRIGTFLIVYLNTPVFEQDAIKSFTAEKNGSDVVITFIVSGSDMEYGFPQRVMYEINPTLEDKLDDVTIVLTIDCNGVPKSMSTKLSMSILNDDGGLHAQKSLDMNFVFNKFDNVDFDLQKVVSEYASNPSVFK